MVNRGMIEDYRDREGNQNGDNGQIGMILLG